MPGEDKTLDRKETAKGDRRAEVAINRMLIVGYGQKSAEELSEETGIAPQDILKRWNALIGTRDPLDESAKIQSILARLDSASAEVEARLKDMNDRNLPGAINAMRGALNSMLKEFRELRKESEVDVNAITETHGKFLFQMVNLTIEHLRAELKDRYGTDDDEIDTIVLDGLALAQDAMEERIVD